MKSHPFCLALIALLFGCASTPEQPRIRIDERANPWSHLDLHNDPTAFQFAIVTDRTGGHRPGVFPDALGKLNLLQPEFVMSVGDLIEGGTEDRLVLKQEWDEFEGFVDELEMPFFYLPGNHDISNPVMAEVWEERFGRSYYHFLYHDVLFIGLNTEDTRRGFIGSEQRAWLEEVLAANADVRWTLVFMHEPLWQYGDGEGNLRDTGWSEAEQMLQGRPYTVFAGHFHSYTKFVRHDRRYFILATTGGGSSLAGPLWGQFDHVVWVTMTQAGPRIANLMLDGIWDEDIRTEQTARLMSPLISGRAVRGEPVIVEDRHIATATAVLRLTNDADVPLSVEGRFAAHNVLQLDLESVATTIPPNSVERVEIALETAAATPVELVQPLVFDWSASYYGDLQLPAIEGRSRIQFAPPLFDLVYRDRPVTIDADLEEWQDDFVFDIRQPSEIDRGESTWTGAGDCSWRFVVAYDEDFLYVATEVTDDTHIYKREHAWVQDGIEILVRNPSAPWAAATSRASSSSPSGPATTRATWSSTLRTWRRRGFGPSAGRPSPVTPTRWRFRSNG